MEPTFIFPTTTTSTETVLIPQVGLVTDSPSGSAFSGTDFSQYFSLDAVLHFLNIIWTFYVIVAYIIAIILLVIYVYAATRMKQLNDLRSEMVKERERIYDERFRSGPKNDRLSDIQTHIASEHPNDWKLAIIEADIMLDETLKSRGYTGNSLGERLRSVTASQLQSIDDAWQAHKIRNQVAHGGADFILTRRLAEDTIKQYRRVLTELGAL